MNEFWVDRRVFITGASGLLGSWLVRALVRLKADVVVLLRDWVPNSLLVKEDLFATITVINGDLSDLYLLERVLTEYEIKTVFHLAAQTIVPIANANPLSTFQANVAGTWNILESCRKLSQQISEIVIASTDKVYGDGDLPYRENDPLSAIFPYDVSKACADMVAMCYAKTWGLPVSITRCGNFFGGGDLNWSRIVPGTIRQILRGERPVIRSNGNLLRDYIYIEDAVSAYLALAEKMTQRNDVQGQAFNFSNGLPMTTLQLIDKIQMIMRSSFEPIVLDEALFEIEAQYLDCTKANTLLGWQPTFGIDDGLKKTVSWYQGLFRE